jgi:hypothetical protein
MKTRLRLSCSVLLALALLGAGVAAGQDSTTRTTDVLTFEVLSVDGNSLGARPSLKRRAPPRPRC